MAFLNETGLQKLVENINKKIDGLKENLADNVSYVQDILIDDWVLIEGTYKVAITHPLKTQRIAVTAIDTATKDRLFIHDKAISDSTVELEIDTPKDITVLIINGASEIKALELPIDDVNNSTVTSWSGSKSQTEIDNVKQITDKNTTDITTITTDLKMSENSKYNTTNGIKEFIVSQQRGYVDNVSISGETLVNIIDKLYRINGSNPDGTVRTRFSSINDTFVSNSRLSTGTWTFYNMTDKSIAFVGVDASNSWVSSPVGVVKANSYKTVTLDGSCAIAGVDFRPADGWSNSDLSIYKETMLMVVEGEHKELPYFTGIKSIGQDDKIEVLTQGKNIFDGLVEKGSLSPTTGEPLANDNCVRSVNFTTFDSIRDLKYWNDKSYGTYLLYYDKDKKFLQAGGTAPLNARYFKFRSLIGNVENDISVKYVFSYETVNGYISPQYDKKQILTTLRSLPNGMKDVIYKQGDKYYKIKRCEEIILNGLEDWKDTNGNDNCISAYISLTNASPKNDANIFSDKLLAVTRANQLDTTVNSVAISGSKNLAISIVKTSLSSADVIGIKSWLSTNQVTIVYELEAPVIEELPNFNPRTFSDKTTILLNSGVVQGEASFEVTNSLRSELEVAKSKITNLDKIFSDVAGWHSTLANTLATKNVEVLSTDKMDDLVNKVNELGDAIFYLYKNGNEYTTRYGSMSYGAIAGYSAGTMTKQSSNILVTQAGSQVGNLIKSNKIDLTPYSKLCVKLKSNAFNSGTTNHYLPTLCVFNNSNDGGGVIYTRSVYSTSLQTVTLDISSLSSSYLVGIQCMGTTYELYEMWLEK